MYLDHLDHLKNTFVFSLGINVFIFIFWTFSYETLNYFFLISNEVILVCIL